MPREAIAPTELGHCAVHGDVVVRIHKAGTNKRGNPRITYRCLDCHLARQNAVNRGEPVPDAPCSIGFCNAEGYVANTSTVCRRPHGHPPDVHVAADGRMFPVRSMQFEER